MGRHPDRAHAGPLARSSVAGRRHEARARRPRRAGAELLVRLRASPVLARARARGRAACDIPRLDRAIPRARSGACALRARSSDLGTGRGRVDPMKGAATAPQIEVLAVERFRLVIPELAGLLVDAVDSGASVGFLPPLPLAEAERWWRTLTEDVSAGRVLVLLLRVDGRAFGTAQLRLAQLPNARHRAEVAKVLVHSSARRHGYGRRLMDAVEQLARDTGRRLLVLATLSGSDAERLYGRLGWTRVAEIPGYAAVPNGLFAATTIYYKDLGPVSSPPPRSA